MHVFATGGTGHADPYIISDLTEAGHKATALARSDAAATAAAVYALGADVRHGDLEGLKQAAVAADGVLAGTHRGHEGFAAFLQTAADEMDTSVIEFQEYVAQGDRVLVVGVASGKIKATDKAWKDDWVFAITVHSGKITKIREYLDTQALAEASTPSTPDNAAGPHADGSDLRAS